MVKINKLNNKKQRHGFWNKHDYKMHYINGKADGCCKCYMGEINYKNDKQIGCELFENHYTNKNYQMIFKYNEAKKFGEILEWVNDKRININL